MKSDRGPVFWVLLAWLLFLSTPGLAQVQILPPLWLLDMPRANAMEVNAHSLALLACCLGHFFLAGVGAPVLLARRLGLAPGRPEGPRGRDFWGGLALLSAGALALCLPLDYTLLTAHPVPLAARALKAAFLLFPWTAAQCLFAFFLFPRLFERIMGQRPLARAAGAAVAVLVLWSMAHVEARYGGLLRAQAADLLWLAPAAVGAVLCRSPLIAFALLFPAQVLAELIRQELAFLPWRPLLVGFLLSFWSAMLYLAAYAPRRFPPREAWSGPAAQAQEPLDSQGRP
jgi:hypothetical protein